MQSKVGEIYEGKVTGLTNFGAFIKLSNGDTGMVHISEVAPVFVKDIREFLTEGQDVKAKVLSIGDNGKISLSIKQTQLSAAPDKKSRPAPARPAVPDKARKPRPQPDEPMSFEDMMKKFKAASEEKMSDLKRSTDMGRSNRRGGRS